MSATMPGQAAPSPSPEAKPESPLHPRVVLRKLAEGEAGSLRVLITLAIIWIIFAIAHDRFLTPINLTNLALQSVAVGTISVGVVLVLLLGEIDLSVGAVSGLSAAIVASLSVKSGWAPVPALLVGFAAALAIGFFQGSIATRLSIPTFVVTLAGLLTWQGAQLKVLGTTGTLNITDPTITGLTSTFFSDVVGWILAAVGIAWLALAALRRRRRRARKQLPTESNGLLVARLLAPSAAIIATVAVLNADRGVPLALLILVGLVMIVNTVLTRSTYGRHIYAIGGNAEAARRAGIRVQWIQTSVFMLASLFAAAGGIMAASRLLAVNQSSGGGDVLLMSIAGPVVAGVSLFGGRGSVWGALLGSLVIVSISNGMDLLALDTAVKFMVTGGVLLAAVASDAITRSRRRSAGRA
ncbi:sugar ABC transporter permease [Solirubrobacter ginsenosidimutans]|uniref:Xylose transport system permease protein XylH n=1 Tax=Solirubrobacter ginsenosidimutans TaxID=490573 RepID=A0A9X3N0U1_9ACTN|nr:sugar ABC transporter permease [Solirubrobacter ginsenosidimutans]MDA0164915.1 sugar ABC transporter permease [Solirubrobacter ginsenosidimutans]